MMKNLLAAAVVLLSACGGPMDTLETPGAYETVVVPEVDAGSPEAPDAGERCASVHPLRPEPSCESLWYRKDAGSP